MALFLEFNILFAQKLRIKSFFYCVFAFFLFFGHFGSALAGNAPSGFIQNKGQLFDQNGNHNRNVQYLFAQGDLHIQFTQTGFSYEIFKLKENKVEIGKTSEYEINRIDIAFLKLKKNAVWTAENENLEVYNFYNKRGAFTNIKSFKQLTLKEAWPGVDIIFRYGDSDRVKYEIHAANTEALSQVKFKVLGASSIDVLEDKITYYIGRRRKKYYNKYFKIQRQ